VEAVPVAIREKVVRYARMDGCTMAEWLTKAAETQAGRQEANLVIPPGKPETPFLSSPTLDLGDVTHRLSGLAPISSPSSIAARIGSGLWLSQ
jgi:hypothetical protein